MLPSYMDFLKKPVDQEFFTKFLGIFSRDQSGNAVAIRLTPTNSIDHSSKGYTVYCDKIRIGETIETAVLRTVREEFGLDLIDYYVPVFALDVEKNRLGEPVTRFPIVAYVSFGNLKNLPLVNFVVSWIDRDSYEYFSCEALQWLSRNEKSVIFDHEQHNVDRLEMIEFVKNLYTAGAIDITLGDTNEQYYEYPEPGYLFVPDYMDIRLPNDVERRKNIQVVCEKGIRGGTKNPIDTSSENTTIKYFFH